MVPRTVAAMRSRAWQSALLVLLIVMHSGVERGTAASHLQSDIDSSAAFVSLRLPEGIALDIPANWTVMDAEGRAVVGRKAQTTVGAVALDLTGFRLNLGEVVFVAQSPSPAYASVSLVIQAGPAETQADIRALSSSDMQRDDELTQRMFAGVAQKSGWRIIEWQGLGKQEINNEHIAVATRYRRQWSANPIVQGQIYSIPLGSRNITLTLEHREDEGALWMPVMARILRSFKRR